MFKGTYQHSIDIKGRLRMPTKFREKLGETFTVTRGTGQCLFVYSDDEWNSFTQKLRELPISDKDAQAFMRLFFGSASDCEVDGQGRILLPQHLRDYAKLDKDIVLLGVYNRVEIWSQEIWDKYNNDYSGGPYEDIFSMLAPRGI